MRISDLEFRRVLFRSDEDRFMEGKLLKARLAADMLPLGRQIQIACDNAKNGLARLTGHNAPWFNDEEKYFVQYRPGWEEHKSELQSLMRSSYAVFCSKKKQQNHIQQTEQHTPEHP